MHINIFEEQQDKRKNNAREPNGLEVMSGSKDHVSNECPGGRDMKPTCLPTHTDLCCGQCDPFTRKSSVEIRIQAFGSR